MRSACLRFDREINEIGVDKLGKRTGSPRGRPRGPWPLIQYRYALRLALFRRLPDGRRYIDVIAERLVERAVDGDAHAILEIGNRLDGRIGPKARYTS